MFRRIRSAAPAAFAAAVLLATAAEAPAQDAASSRARAKQVLETYRDAVVTVKAAIKMQGGFGGGDQQVEVTGTVVDPSGMTVVSESQLDPMAMFSGMFGEGESPFGNITAEAGDVKLVLKDGKEVPARVVLRDKDLDLAFLAPEEKGLKLTCVPLEPGKAPDIMDEVVVLGRLGKNLDRAPTVDLGAVMAVVKKPRTFYVTNASSAMMAFGCPAFDASGKAVGILLKRRAPSGGGGLTALIGSLMPVILPCDDVKEVMKQAMEEAAKPPPEKKEEKKEEAAPAGEGEKKEEAGEKKEEKEETGEKDE